MCFFDGAKPIQAEVAEWPNAPALRAGVERLREFKSRPLRIPFFVKKAISFGKKHKLFKRIIEDNLCQKKNQ